MARAISALFSVLVIEAAKVFPEAASLDLEIIAQREADEEDEDDRNKVLADHQELKPFRRNGRQATKSAAGAK
jgi:hypothetical protein